VAHRQALRWLTGKSWHVRIDLPAGSRRNQKAAAEQIDPIHQFNIERFFNDRPYRQSNDRFTNSVLYMSCGWPVIRSDDRPRRRAAGSLPGVSSSMAEISLRVSRQPRSAARAGGGSIEGFSVIFSLFMFHSAFRNLGGSILYKFTI